MRTTFAAALQLAEKIKEWVPRGLKSAREVENKQLKRWPEGQLYL
jgi:hypothetical protein